MNFDWKILELSANEGQITSAKYHCTVSEDNLSVETEGNWKFEAGENSVPFAEVTEELVSSGMLCCWRTRGACRSSG